MRKMRALDVAMALKAGPIVAKVGPAVYGIGKVEPKRGGHFLYVHLEKDGDLRYPGGGNGTRFFLPGDQAVDVGSVEAGPAGVQIVNLGAAAVKTECSVKLTTEEAQLVRDALAAYEPVHTAGQNEPATKAARKLRGKVPAGEVKQ